MTKEEQKIYDKKYQFKNRDEINIRRRKYRAKNKEKFKEYHRVRDLKRNYGISTIEYDELFLKQNGLCAICIRPETVKQKGELKKLAIDHNHETGKIRGLLCTRCNSGIGMFDDNPQRVKVALEYLLNT